MIFQWNSRPKCYCKFAAQTKVTPSDENVCNCQAKHHLFLNYSSSIVDEINIELNCCSYAFIRSTHPFRSKKNKTLSSNRGWTNKKQQFRHMISKLMVALLCTDHTRTMHGFRQRKPYHIKRFMRARYAGTAKLGSDQRVGSTTRHGSDFLNSATCRVQQKIDDNLEPKVHEKIELG